MLHVVSKGTPLRTKSLKDIKFEFFTLINWEHLKQKYVPKTVQKYTWK
jgi:hypothetical protein